MRIIIALFFCVALSAQTYAQMDAVWENLNEQNYAGAHKELQKLQSDPGTAVDAAATEILLSLIEDSNVDNQAVMAKLIEHAENPSPYVFALWYTDAVTEGMGYQSKKELAFLNQIQSNPLIHESIKTALYYAKGIHYLYAQDSKNVALSYNQVNAITDWQFTGTFDNTSGSGVDKNYEPIANPKPDAIFKSKKNANVHWFKPGQKDVDPWMTFLNILPGSQGVVFAQTFVKNTANREVQVSLGGEGSLKLWVNDKLIISEEDEQRTELDYYTRIITLPKGNNRILIQLSYTDDTNYPNFLLRLLDPKTLKAIDDIEVVPTYSAYNAPSTVKVVSEIPHFAEDFFEKKLKNDNSNLVDHLLLAKCYERAGRHNEAIKMLEKGKKIDSTNIILNTMLITSYQKVNDRTALMLQLEKLRQLDPNLLMLQVYDYEIAKENEDIDKAAGLLEKMKNQIGENSVTHYKYKIEMFSAQKEYQKLYDCIDEAYNKYPHYPLFVRYQYFVQKTKKQSAAKAMPILLKYNKQRYNANIRELIVSEYKEIGSKEKARKIMLDNLSKFPDELDFLNDLMLLDYRQENYSEALKSANQMIANAPFQASYYQNRAFIKLAMDKTDEAKADFVKAIHFNPNSFDSREKLRTLEDKDSWSKILENSDAYTIIENSFTDKLESDEKYDYVFLEKSVVQFEEGAGVEFNSYGIRILNKSGIDIWKEVRIPSNYNSEDLVILKAEINKSSGQKLEGERNYNQIVFPTLEVGDIIYLEFRKDVYTGGKLAKEISIIHNFSEFVPVSNALYRIYIPESYTVDIVEEGFTGEKKEFDFEGFHCTEFRYDKIKKTEEEKFMPELSEIGESITITTMPSWEVISSWYNDLAIPMAKEDYNLDQVYDEIFNGQENASTQEKAELIYAYLCENINYSSVSFRQSNFVPQKPMVTISTKLGDCKDLSMLYHTLANKAGLNTNLVLVNTRDNGEKTMKVPSTGFNHCIIRIELDEDTLFQELTDSKLPFGSLPDYLFNAQALIIDNTDEIVLGTDLIHIPNNKILENKVVRQVDVKIEGTKMKLITEADFIGNQASDYRWYFADQTSVELKKTIDDYCGDFFESDIKVNEYDMENLENLNENFILSIDMTIEDEVKSIGSLQTFAVPFFETIFTLDKFPDIERQHPLNYWKYETVDQYLTTVKVQIDSDQEFVEIPSNVSVSNQFIEFSLTVKKISSTEIEITRSVKPKMGTIAKEDYAAFRATVKEISKAEETFIAYKNK
jgi:Tfp pilus assembly protein PilF